ncbi:beta-ketoacyl-ACP synthase II [Slackia heliotrinireducens]|uniref:beta-ketoacyl-ACP synthase II n=1 Tax=Slackia heliotrinireducens TaxID=84110 RepID=UPI003314D5B9
MKEPRRVVVTGLGVVSPLGSDMDTFWKNVTDGACGIGPITRFDTSQYKAKVAAEVKDFDPAQYLSTNELLRTDLYAQYAIGAAEQAVSESGIVGTLPPDRLGVYFGSGIGGLETVCSGVAKLNEQGPRRVSSLIIPMMIANMAAGLIAIRYDCQNGAMPAVTACATGSNAIGEAVRTIRHGYADAVIAGGSEASIVPLGVAGFVNMRALSTADDPMAASLPFDARRAGFVMGEGAGALVLEELEHARARNAHIYGEISGYGSTCDAYHMTASHPEGDGGRRAIAQALEESGYTGDERLYINAHGTGTPINDACETLAIKGALGQEKGREALVSSTKSMTGHMLGAAGAVEAIVCLKVLQTGIVPPTINLLEPDPECDLNHVAQTAVQAEIDLCLSNSLGFGGHNATLAFRKV